MLNERNLSMKKVIVALYEVDRSQGVIITQERTELLEHTISVDGKEYLMVYTVLDSSESVYVFDSYGHSSMEKLPIPFTELVLLDYLRLIYSNIETWDMIFYSNDKLIRKYKSVLDLYKDTMTVEVFFEIFTDIKIQLPYPVFELNNNLEDKIETAKTKVSVYFNIMRFNKINATENELERNEDNE